MLRLLRNLLVVLALVVCVVFAFYNHQVVQVDLLWKNTSAPLVLLLAFALILGFMMALIIYGPRIFRLRRRLAKLQRRLQKTEARVLDVTERTAGGNKSSS